MLQQLPEETLDICFAYLDVATLVRLAACNHWQAAYCRQYAERNASRLLVESVALAADLPHRSSTVAWLLAVAPQAALTTAADELLRIPCVPLEVATMLCENGMKVALPQVAASAAAGVAGAEVWCDASSMPLMSQQDANGVSKVRSVRFCLDRLYFGQAIAHEVDLQELPMLLQIANNVGQPRCAYNLLCYIYWYRQLPADQAAMPQLSEASFVEQLLKVALIRRTDCRDYQAEPIIMWLLALPGATHLSVEAILSFLQAALHCHINERVLIHLKKRVPAVTSVFDKNATMQLLLRAVHHYNTDMLCFLCGLPAIKQLNADDISVVVLEVSKHRLNGILPILLELQQSKT